MERLRQLVSSDSIGITGGVDQLLTVNQHGFDRVFTGVELLGLRPEARMHEMIAHLESYNIRVEHVHSQTGGVGSSPHDTVKLLVANALMVDASRVVSQFGANRGILFHTPRLSDRRLRQAIESKPPHHIWVENHHGPNAINDMIQMVDALRISGIDASAMLDPVHMLTPVVVSNPDLFAPAFENFLTQLPSLLRAHDTQCRPYIKGMHLPTGTDRTDSLPMAFLSKNQALLSQLGQIIQQSSLNTLVVEHQTGNFQQTMRLTPQQVREQQARKSDIVDLLIDTNILTLKIP